MVLLHRIYGSSYVCSFEEWMYFYIQIVLKGSQFLDWVELVASSLRSYLRGYLSMKKYFYMSSYLSYMLASTQYLRYLPHEPWAENITVYNYYLVLHRDKVLESFRKVHYTFS